MRVSSFRCECCRAVVWPARVANNSIRCCPRLEDTMHPCNRRQSRIGLPASGCTRCSIPPPDDVGCIVRTDMQESQLSEIIHYIQRRMPLALVSHAGRVPREGSFSDAHTLPRAASNAKQARQNSPTHSSSPVQTRSIHCIRALLEPLLQWPCWWVLGCTEAGGGLQCTPAPHIALKRTAECWAVQAAVQDRRAERAHDHL